LENPYIRTEDISAVIDYLTTLPYVDSDRDVPRYVDEVVSKLALFFKANLSGVTKSASSAAD
jgi:hypothetical protein